MKKWLILPLLMVCVFAFVGCKKNPPSAIVISGTASIAISESTQLTATIDPAKADQSVTWATSNAAIATVSETGLVTGLAAGRVSITATSVANPELTQPILITVRGGGTETEYPDLQGYVITIMTKALNEYDPFHRNAENEEDYAASDKEAKKAAFTSVKKLYNCDIAVIDYPTGADWGQTRIDYINLQGSLGTPDADFYIVGSDWIPDFVEGGSVVDLTDFYGTYGEDKMDPAFRQACTYKGRLYGMTNGGAGLINGLFYNIDLINTIQMDTPAKMFNDDNWTYTDFKDWALEAQSKLDSGQFALSGHGVYYWYGMTISAGVRIANLDNLIIDYQNENAVAAAQTLKDVFTANAFDPAFNHDAGSVAFNTGNAIFCPGQFWFLNADNRWATYRGELFDIGYVPYPYADTMTKADARVAMPDEAVYIMATGRTADQESVYRAINDMFLMTRENVENAPGYDEYELRLQNAQRLTDDPESVTAIMYINDKGDNETNLRYFFDPLEGVYSFTQPDGLGPALRTIIQGGDYQQTMTTVIPVVEAELNRKYG